MSFRYQVEIENSTLSKTYADPVEALKVLAKELNDYIHEVENGHLQLGEGYRFEVALVKSPGEAA